MRAGHPGIRDGGLADTHRFRELAVLTSADSRPRGQSTRDAYHEVNVIFSNQAVVHECKLEAFTGAREETSDSGSTRCPSP